MIILKFGETKITKKKRKKKKKKKKVYAAKRHIKIWDIVVDDIVISKLIKTKTNSKYLIRYLDNVIRPLVLMMPKNE